MHEVARWNKPLGSGGAAVTAPAPDLSSDGIEVDIVVTDDLKKIEK